MIKVLIVDDHAIVRRGLKELLTDEPDISVFEAGDGETASELIRKDHWDLIVLDLDLPGKSGLQLLEEVKRDSRSIPVLVLSVYSEEQFAVRTLRAGAAGFMSKDSAAEDLILAIRRILGGGKHISQTVAELLLSQATPDSDAHTSPHEKLSDREFQILRLFGSGKTVSGIARELSISIPTVSTYRARILEKMELKTTAELIRYAVQNRLVP
ncbi:MAG TPA: response regulator transcription factor [Pyrinomonadaceae bacterium]|jgi:two-component system invasion response regulator UvrY|nr:response regulator transcription factor [Pyrinomonadaceae bacterium]